MKSQMEIKEKLLPGFFLWMGILTFFYCSSPEVLGPSKENKNPTKISNILKSKESNPELLRLTYDIAFRPPPGYILEEKSSLHDRGNLYRVKFPIELYGFEYLKISSTQSENYNFFEYEVSKKEFEVAKWKKYYYLPVQNKTNPATITLFACGKNLVCARWEWTYNGFLVVFESKGNPPDQEQGLNLKAIAENYHQIIEKHLLVY